MKTLSPDTHPEIERMHIEMIRKAPVFRRLQMAASLIKTTRQLSWKGICDRYPKDTEETRIKRFFCLLYEDETIAKKVTDLIIRKKK